MPRDYNDTSNHDRRDERKLDDDAPASYAVEVIADRSGQWAGNACRYDTHELAEREGRSLASRWMLVTDMRVVPSDEAPNYTLVEGRLARI